MADITDLLITECPRAFVDFAEKHNDLVRLIRNMAGDDGVKIVVSKKNIAVRSNPASASNTTQIETVVGGIIGRIYSAAISVAGVVPTATEIATAIENAYIGQPAPRVDDTIALTVGGVIKFRARVHTLSAVATGLFVVGFTVNGVTRYAHIHQVGIY
jgi:hypothetical protein